MVEHSRRALLGASAAALAALAGCPGSGEDGTVADTEGAGTAAPTATGAGSTTADGETPTPSGEGTVASTTAADYGGGTVASMTPAEPQGTTVASMTPAETGTTTTAATVSMDELSYQPRRLSVSPGTTVVWGNDYSVTHNVVSARFHDVATAWDYNSGPVEPSETTSHTFEEAGVYEYYCSIHSKWDMSGAVLVGDVTLEAALPSEQGRDS